MPDLFKTKRHLNRSERIFLSLAAAIASSCLYYILLPSQPEGAGQVGGLAAIGTYFGTKNMSREVKAGLQATKLSKLLSTPEQRRAFIIFLVGITLMTASALYEVFVVQSSYSSAFWGRRLLWGPLRAIRITMDPETQGGLLLLFWIGMTMALYGASRAFFSKWLWQPIQRWINQP